MICSGHAAERGEEGFVDKGGSESTLFGENDALDIKNLPSLSIISQAELWMERKTRISVS